MNVVFRFDASYEIGIGHLMRCLALSEELIKRGDRCYFLSKIDDERLIKKYNVDYQKINTNTSLKKDLEMLIKFSNNNDVDWIITDHYKIDSKYVKEIKQNGFNVLSVDDTAQIHYYSDIVVNQNIGAKKLDFSSERYTRFLLGPKYIIMRDDLLQREKKSENDKVKKILVTFGGSDSGNFTLKILKMLDSINENVEFLVVLGPLNSFYEDIKRYARKTDNEIKLIKSTEDMTKIYIESDIAISAGGITCYELAYFGIPNIIIPIADNQINSTKGLDETKVSIYLGERNMINAECLRKKIKELIKNDSLRQKMRRNGKKLIDGEGKKRIVDFMRRYN